uniref:Putative secreted protein n=1 Tax=Ixodes ricinus TaxID=34613 RepID=A0A147BVZ4_IXORI
MSFFLASAGFFFKFFNAFCKVFCSPTLPMHSRPHCTRIEKCIHFARVKGGGQNFDVRVGNAFITRGKKRSRKFESRLGGCVHYASAFIVRVNTV